MENGGNLFNSNGYRGQNGNYNNLISSDIWELGTSRFDWTTSSFNQEEDTTTPTNPSHALMFSSKAHAHAHAHLHRPLYAGGGSHVHPDPHLTCLKLGKRHYFEDATATPLGAGFSIGKRGRPYNGVTTVGGPSSSPAVGLTASVPRCQVEGCHVLLVNAKDYHRRHKVCDMHSKAPKVVVLGIEQRFCQQCSRFHVVSEFDDSKRSCRRRLAGHNERRRKSSNDSIIRNPSHETKSIHGRFPSISASTGRALSLLSSADISSRSSAALRELIAENRAAVLAKQLFERGWHHHTVDDVSAPLSHVLHQHQVFPNPPEWDSFDEADTHVTLDLMQAPSSQFGFQSGRSKSKEEEECCEIWKTLEGTHVA